MVYPLSDKGLKSKKKNDLNNPNIKLGDSGKKSLGKAKQIILQYMKKWLVLFLVRYIWIKL